MEQEAYEEIKHLKKQIKLLRCFIRENASGQNILRDVKRSYSISIAEKFFRTLTPYRSIK